MAVCTWVSEFFQIHARDVWEFMTSRNGSVDIRYLSQSEADLIVGSGLTTEVEKHI